MNDEARGSAASGYALCTVGRSGSNWLCEVLSSTGMLGYPLEYFNGLARRRFTDPSYPDEPQEQIRWILTKGSTPNGVYGVKVFPVHLDELAGRVRWTEALPNLRFVHFERRDTLGQAISAHRAECTDQYRSTQDLRGLAHYDGQRILAYLRLMVREQARWKSYFARNGILPARLVYEDLVADPQSACDAIARLLGLKTRPIMDAGRIDLTVQRDRLTEEWRARFHEEFADRGRIDIDSSA